MCGHLQRGLQSPSLLSFTARDAVSSALHRDNLLKLEASHQTIFS